jgi:anaerobic ribonucleoside-triphosphate reductase activating protein
MEPTHEEVILRVAQLVPSTEAEGPGRRFALWFQGCPLRCPGCCNPEMLAFEGGRAIPLSEILTQLGQVRDRIEGITLLGGEPLAHGESAAVLAGAVRDMGLSVMVFTGYTLEEVRTMSDPAVIALLSQTDILVDGPFRRDLPERRRRWIGSSNQRVHFLSDRYRPEDPCWLRPNTLEIRFADGEITINGFPAQNARGLWHRLTVRGQETCGERRNP